MFIYNVKVSGSKLFKVFAITVSVIVILLFGISVYRIFSYAKNDVSITDGISSTDVSEITSKNYTNILKAVHDNLDTYVGKKIKFSGYLYRVYDFKDTQFVLARDMVISSDYQTLIVGFLCDSEEAKQLKDDTWVEITGEITKGDYHGEMPEIKVTDLKEIEKPNDEYVYPPDEGYVPTVSIQ